MNDSKEPTFSEKLEQIRRHFLLQSIYFVHQTIKNEDKEVALENYLIYINSPDETAVLESILLPHYEAYKNTLDDLWDSADSLLDIEDVLNIESREINKNIREYSLIDNFNFPTLVGFLDKGNGAVVPFHYTNDLISPEYKTYLKEHFIYRRSWLIKLNDLLVEALDKLLRTKNLNNDFKQVFTRTASKNVTEIWYPLEKEFFSKKYDRYEILALRAQFFRFFGINDKGYGSSVGHIKDLVRDDCTLFLDYLAEIIKNNFSDSPKASVRKSNAKQKKSK